MAGDPFGESEASHDSQTCCEPLLSVETLSLEVDLRFGAIERDALLVGLERAEIGFLGVGHGVRLRVAVTVGRVVRSEKGVHVGDPGFVHRKPRPLASLFALEDAYLHQLGQVMADRRLRSADECRQVAGARLAAGCDDADEAQSDRVGEGLQDHGHRRCLALADWGSKDGRAAEVVHVRHFHESSP